MRVTERSVGADGGMARAQAGDGGCGDRGDGDEIDGGGEIVAIRGEGECGADAFDVAKRREARQVGFKAPESGDAGGAKPAGEEVPHRVRA